MYTLSLSATNGASANGSDTNTVTATLLNGSSYVSNAVIDFRIVSGNALFSNEKQQITASTSVLGEATVSFTDTREETVSLLAILSSDATVYQSASSSFSANGDNTKYTLALTATSTASANGIDPNTATAMLRKDGLPADSEILSFSIATGNAILSTTTAVTNINGQATVSFTDQTAETVTLLATLEKDTSVYQTVSSEFAPVSIPLTVTRVYNDNGKNFSANGPNNLFVGASFYIELNKKSMPITWSCDDSNVSVENVNGLGFVLIKGTPASEVIKIAFSNGSNKGGYEVICRLYLDDVHAENGANTPTAPQLVSIYNEWGDMSAFGWGKGNSLKYYYRTGNYGTYDYVDMRSGILGEMSHPEDERDLSFANKKALLE